MGSNTIQGTGQHIPTAGADHTAPAGEVGGQEVRESIGSKIKQAFSDFGSKIASFFKGIGDKYTAWREARAEAQQQARQDRASNSIKANARILLTDLQANQPTRTPTTRPKVCARFSMTWSAKWISTMSIRW